jgi:hypothetical protein
MSDIDDAAVIRPPSYRDGAPTPQPHLDHSGAVILHMRCEQNALNSFSEHNVSLSCNNVPCTKGSPNAQIFKFAPAGAISLNSVNSVAAKLFERGEVYEVTFRKLPSAKSGH